MTTGKKPENSQRNRLLETIHSTIQTLAWENHKRSTELMKELDLTLPQGIVLLSLMSLGNRAKMSELIDLIQISGGTLTGIVDRLITAGMVARERDEADRRVVYVYLTEAGTTKVQAIQQANRVQLDLGMVGFSNQELEQFNTFLKKFVEAANTSTPEPVLEQPELLESYDLALAESLVSPGPGQPNDGNVHEKDLSGKPLVSKEQSYD